MSLRSKLIRLANENPEVQKSITDALRTAEETDPNRVKIDHGYDQPLSGGWDIMKRLQDQLLIEQGREPREPNPRLANGLRDMTWREAGMYEWKYTDDDRELKIEVAQEAMQDAKRGRYADAIRKLREIPLMRQDYKGQQTKSLAISMLDDAAYEEIPQAAALKALQKFIDEL